MIKYDPDHFGRDPFRPPGHVKPATWVNVGDLDLLARGEKLIDLTSMGYEKLLGSGKVAGSYEVAVDSFTKKAQAKIEAAGGKVAVKE
jgi:large subunit ribosomal protein L15